ncbi:SDR family NAD(P)-dependent oxidoreductase [Paenibacillus flagellatus]|uniref:2-deoxy-D-gluconate 3-dehydrogenase n=1 Tax=Paenibacillus flagellatus TaxID=2211139 RepID=A0A2V5K8K4_9BACL|nr:glucose 1-dehydrogenase [Paenibacillus flagellatus]PYI55202.1 2-deoxy-D-gluconate 3-dehydrogenase [Paenibacillus flagellatus]
MMLPSFRLDGKTAIVTGAGRALAIGLAEAGADVALLARTEADIRLVAREIESGTGRKAYPIAADATSRDQLEAAVDRIADAAGGIDILINNAGMNIRTPALDVTDEEWRTIVDTNLKSAFLASQLCARYMRERGGGRIVNISSVAGHVALRTGVVYGATKAALIQMTKTLALEWGKLGIRVNAVGPWYFRTPLTEKLLADEAFVAEVVSRTPLGRIGELPDLVGAVVFLASDASGYVTGQTLFVDGGMTIYGF